MNQPRQPATRDAFPRGAALYDRGEFFAAHEVWEERWRESVDPQERQFLQGLIQVAAAWHKHFVMASPLSARRLLARGLAKLDASPNLVSGFDLDAFRQALRACEATLAADSLDRSQVPRMLG